jgi:hypothetical protein
VKTPVLAPATRPGVRPGVASSRWGVALLRWAECSARRRGPARRREVSEMRPGTRPAGSASRRGRRRRVGGAIARRSGGGDGPPRRRGGRSPSSSSCARSGPGAGGGAHASLAIIRAGRYIGIQPIRVTDSPVSISRRQSSVCRTGPGCRASQCGRRHVSLGSSASHAVQRHASVARITRKRRYQNGYSRAD